MVADFDSVRGNGGRSHLGDDIREPSRLDIACQEYLAFSKTTRRAMETRL